MKSRLSVNQSERNWWIYKRAENIAQMAVSADCPKCCWTKLCTGARKGLVTGTLKRPGTLEKWHGILHWNLKWLVAKSQAETQHSGKWLTHVKWPGKWPGTPERRTDRKVTSLEPESDTTLCTEKGQERQPLRVKATRRPRTWPLRTAVERASSCWDERGILTWHVQDYVYRTEYQASEWVSSFLTAHQYILGYSVPFIHSVLLTVW